MSNEKTYPTHRISFSESMPDGRGGEQLGKPTEVATVWPRKEGKQGGIIDWHINPSKLGDGVYFHLDNERHQKQDTQRSDGFDNVDNQEKSRDQGRER